MGVISREQFLQQQKRKAEIAAGNFEAQSGPRIGYFSLKNDEDESVVRFIYSDDEQIYNDIVITHRTTIDGKFRRVNCLRDYNEPFDKCPLCKAGDQNQQRLYIKLIEYTRDEDGNIVATPKIWERPTSYVGILMDKYAEYGSLKDNIFKVKRHGVAGDMKTTYSINFANPQIYNSELYPADFSAFDNYKIVGSAVVDKSYDELVELAGGQPAEQPAAAPRKVTY